MERMPNCYVFSLTARTSATSRSSSRTRRRALTHVRFWHMISPASGSVCSAWCCSRSSTLTIGGSGEVALKAASLLRAAARLRALISRSTLWPLRLLCCDCRCFSRFNRCEEHPGRGRGQGPAGIKVLPVARKFRMPLSRMFWRKWISLRCFATKCSTFPQMGHSPMVFGFVICKSHEILVEYVIA